MVNIRKIKKFDIAQYISVYIMYCFSPSVVFLQTSAILDYECILLTLIIYVYNVHVSSSEFTFLTIPAITDTLYSFVYSNAIELITLHHHYYQYCVW